MYFFYCYPDCPSCPFLVNSICIALMRNLGSLGSNEEMHAHPSFSCSYTTSKENIDLVIVNGQEYIKHLSDFPFDSVLHLAPICLHVCVLMTPSLAGTWAIIKVSGHQYQLSASEYDLGIGHFRSG